jgi:Predicted oxidoreductases (related to aryl-alcohol dehydrogenases)
MSQVNIFYLHSPDRKADLKDTLSGINELYKKGKFKKFGLSNFLVHEIEDVVRVAQEINFVLPWVYQGSYSATAWRQEKELFPVLREHNIRFTHIAHSLEGS